MRRGGGHEPEIEGVIRLEEADGIAVLCVRGYGGDPSEARLRAGVGRYRPLPGQDRTVGEAGEWQLDFVIPVEAAISGRLELEVRDGSAIPVPAWHAGEASAPSAGWASRETREWAAAQLRETRRELDTARDAFDAALLHQRSEVRSARARSAAADQERDEALRQAAGHQHRSEAARTREERAVEELRRSQEALAKARRSHDALRGGLRDLRSELVRRGEEVADLRHALQVAQERLDATGHVSEARAANIELERMAREAALEELKDARDEIEILCDVLRVEENARAEFERRLREERERARAAGRTDAADWARLEGRLTQVQHDLEEMRAQRDEARSAAETAERDLTDLRRSIGLGDAGPLPQRRFERG